MFSKRLTPSKQTNTYWPQDELTAAKLNILFANIFCGDPKAVKLLLIDNDDLLELNCPNIQDLTALQYAWVLRDLSMTKLLLTHFWQRNNGIEIAYEQIKDLMPDKLTYGSRHWNLFFNTINFDILRKRTILRTDRRTDLDNLTKFRMRCKEIGHFDIYDLRTLITLINSECHDYFNAHVFSNKTDDGTTTSEIYKFIGEHVLNYMMRFAPHYLKDAWSDVLVDMHQFDKYFFKDLKEWIYDYEKSLREEFSALRKDMKHDMRLNKFSNIMHSIFSVKEKSSPNYRSLEAVKCCHH